MLPSAAMDFQILSLLKGSGLFRILGSRTGQRKYKKNLERLVAQTVRNCLKSYENQVEGVACCQICNKKTTNNK